MRRNCLKKYLNAKSGLVAAALILTGCAGQAPAPADYKAWNTFSYNDARTNISPDKLMLPLAVSWTDDISSFRLLPPFPKEELSSPAISNGALYTGSTDERFYSYDLKSGKVLWKFNAKYPLEAPPTVAGDLVCFGSADGIMRCFNNKTGKQLWEYQAKSEILSSPIIKEDKLFFSSSDDRVYALSLSTGEKLWSYARANFSMVSPRIYGSPAFADNRVYMFFSDGFLTSLSADNGKELWAKKVVKDFNTTRLLRRTPLIDNGTVYIIDENNAVQALNQETGEVKGIYNIIKAYDFIVPDKSSIVIAGSEQIAAIDRLSGTVLWKKDIAYSPVSTIFAADDLLFVLSNYKHTPLGMEFLSKTKGYIQALRLKDGEVVWEEKLKSSSTANASAAEAKVAILTDKGILEVFKTNLK